MIKHIVGPVILISLLSAWSRAAPFDGPFVREHWALEAMRRCEAEEIMSRNAQGSFEGAQLVDRFQAAVIVARLLEKIEWQRTHPVTDEELRAERRTNAERVVRLAERHERLRRSVSGMNERLSRLQARVDGLRRLADRGEKR